MRHHDTPGTYILVVALERDTRLTIGSLGGHDLRAGYYLYVGSALNGLRSRLSRHLRPEKKRHWHIDYLLAIASVCEIWYMESPERHECAWAEALRWSGVVEPAAPGFGSSDCRCGTHLFYSAERPSVETAFMMASTAEGSMSLGSGLPVLRIKGAPEPD